MLFKVSQQKLTTEKDSMFLSAALICGRIWMNVSVLGLTGVP